MKAINLCFLGLVVLTMTSCTSYGGNTRATEQNASDNIKIGKTTKYEVKNMFGNPSSVMKQGDTETWTYGNMQGHINAAAFIPFASMFTPAVNVESSMVTIRFNRSGVVEDVMSNTSNTQSPTLVPH